MRWVDITGFEISEEDDALQKAADGNMRRARIQKLQAEISKLQARIGEKRRKITDLMRG